jgi:hypothetical protein
VVTQATESVSRPFGRRPGVGLITMCMSRQAGQAFEQTVFRDPSKPASQHGRNLGLRQPQDLRGAGLCEPPAMHELGDLGRQLRLNYNTVHLITLMCWA